MRIKDKACHDRPREKLIKFGASYLSDAELLAIFLRTGVKGRSAIDLAEALLDQLGGITGLFSADEKQYFNFNGIGPAKYAQIHAVLELSKRFLKSKIDRELRFTNSKHTQDYLALMLRDRPSEVFACLFLDIRHRILSYDELFYGTISHTNIHPREIIRHCIKTNAAAIILAHNHPSGDPTPSDADVTMTRTIVSALDLIDVRVLDHIIIGAGLNVSMADMDLIN